RMGEWRRSRQRRLETSAPGEHPETRADLLLGDWTPALAAQLPVKGEVSDELQKELLLAGYYRKPALMEYAALRTLLIVTPLVVAGVLALLVEPTQIASVVVGGLVLAILGYSLPRVYLYFRGRQRLRQIEAGLPFAIDMLALCLSAGQNLLAAVKRVARELRFCHPVLADEFDIIRQHAELRSLPHALEQLQTRVPTADIRNFAMIIIQAEKLGTDTGAALIEYSNSLRTNLKQRAEARANKTMFWLLFPTLLCLWIPAAIILIGPAVLEFQEHRRTAVQQWRDSRQEMRTLVGAPQTPPPSPPE
ncbi:MAG TPA: type II secretion system F family protein, partial [Gemmatales bacterium]|nr:type II secretion system F family protein [Gemmatales bacterium]